MKKMTRVKFTIILLLLISIKTVLSFKYATNPTETNQTELEHRRELIVNLTKEAWNSYVKYAWGHGALQPLSQKPSSFSEARTPGRTILSAMTTLWIMGLREEFDQGRAWIACELNLESVEHPVLIQNIVNEYLGSLLSCYALTKDWLFLDKAQQVALAIDKAYRNDSGLFKFLNYKK